MLPKLVLILSQYEPELFPGLIYRMKEVVLLIFVSGKVVLTGDTTTSSLLLMATMSPNFIASCELHLQDADI